LPLFLLFLNNSDDGGGMFAPIEFGESQMYTLIAGGLLIGCQVLARYIYYMRKNGISDLKDLKEKVGHYRSSVIARSALMEGANLIALIFFFLEGNTLFLLIFAIGLAGFLLFRPSLHEFETDYPVNTEDQRALKKLVYLSTCLPVYLSTCPLSTSGSSRNSETSDRFQCRWILLCPVTKLPTYSLRFWSAAAGSDL
jgi:hypothetical protein